MKKLLNVIGAITLIGTTSTSITACGGKEESNQISDQTIVNNIISVINYEINQQIKTDNTYQELKAKILPNFIKSKITKSKIKNAFDNNKLTILKITDNNGQEFSDSDFTSKIIVPNAKIIFNYGNIKNQKVNLKINIENIENINLNVAEALTLYKNGNSDIDQTFFWDDSENDYQWNIGLSSAISGKGKDFHTINFVTSLLTLENKAKNTDIDFFLLNILNLTKNDNGSFNASDLVDYGIEMTPKSYQHGDVVKKQQATGGMGWSAVVDNATSDINIISKYNNKKIVIATFHVSLQETGLSIFSKGQDINLDINNDFNYDKLLYVVGTTAIEFNNTLSAIKSSNNIHRLLKLAIQINVASDLHDFNKISFKISDDSGKPLSSEYILTTNVQYKLSILFDNLEVKDNIDFPILN